MRRVSGSATVGILITAAALGQTEAPKFEAADIHNSVQRSTDQRGAVLRPNGRYDLRTATMVDLIKTAYAVEAEDVVGGPSWLEFDRFDLIAKAPPSTSPETARHMLQALLADRFKLALHKETRPMPALVLTVGKGKARLKESQGASDGGCRRQPPNPAGSIPRFDISCRNVTMEAFAADLRSMATGDLASRVVDQTGLKGLWDFDLQWTPRGLLSLAGAGGISLVDAIDKQLGLKLEPQKLPISVIVVDSVDQKPTPNPPETAAILPPPPPAEFEVASIRPSQGPPNAFVSMFQPGGRLNMPGTPLGLLIRLAFDQDLGPEIVGAPKWMDSATFDLVAKASTDAQLTIEEIRPMLRALLVDRFKMKTHFEERLVEAYALTAAKPKLNKADPSNRTGCKRSVAPGPRDPSDLTPPTVLIACQNMTLAQFASQLQSLAPGYIHYPVLDATALTEAWDFSITFSPAGAGQGDGGRRGPGGAPQPAPPPGVGGASDPTGALSLPDALNRQFGLKLEMQKRPMPMLVIDHLEEKPTEN